MNRAEKRKKLKEINMLNEVVAIIRKYIITRLIRGKIIKKFLVRDVFDKLKVDQKITIL